MRAPVLAGSAALAVAFTLACGGGTGGSEAIDLSYTQWSMEFTVGEDEYYTVDFLADGSYIVDGESDAANTWSVSGETVTMTEDGYTYAGEFVDSWTVGGIVTQLEDGDTWPFRMTRMK